MITTILLDVDGVIGDFTGHALDHFDRPDIKGRKQPAGVYGIHDLLGISASEFWERIDCALFWNSIPRYPGAVEFVHRLYHSCRGSGIMLYYCTAGNVSEFYPGARSKWLRDLNRDAGVDIPMILVPSYREKTLLASPEVLIIEDNDKTLDAFNEKGAATLIVPQMWNRAHAASSETPDYDELLRALMLMLYHHENKNDYREISGKCAGCGGHCGTDCVGTHKLDPAAPIRDLSVHCRG